MLYRPCKKYLETPLFGQPRAPSNGVGEHVVADHRVVGKHPLAGCQLVEHVARKTGPHYLMK